jgi:hypothetical protein
MELTVNAPRWGTMFTDQYIDPENLAIINEGAKRLDKKRFKQLRHIQDECRYVLYGEPMPKPSFIYRLIFQTKTEPLPQFLNYDRAVEQYELCRTYHQQLKALLADAEGVKARRIRHRMSQVKQQAGLLMEYIEVARVWKKRLLYAESRLTEHETAVQFERELNQDRRAMQSEAQFFKNKMVLAWARLGYKYEIINGKRRHVDKVKIEKIWAAEDELIFKIAVARVTLFGSIVSRLPERVRAYDLIKPDTLRELEAALERPVYSPHNPPEYYGSNASFENGAYVCMARVDHRGGLSDYISWSQQMKHYPNDRRHKFPIPLGLKRGRKLNWGVIDNKSPHYMFNGLTGSGKTNAIVGCIATLISNHSPDEIRFILTDLKRGGNFRQFKDVPHNAIDEIIFTTSRLKEVLSRVWVLLYKRLDTIGEYGVDIDEYNARVHVQERLPRLLIVIDEYSETFQIGDDKEIKKSIDAVVDAVARLGRAAGIHLMIGNQQPYSDNIPKQVKGNITYHLTGFQMTMGASMSTVGDKSATEIDKHPGRMIANTGIDKFEVQLPHCTNDDIERAVKIAGNWEEAQPFELPAPPADDTDQPIAIYEPLFTVDNLIEIALSEHDGVIATRKIFEAYGARYNVSMRALEKMRDQVVADGQAVVDDVVYVVEKYGKGYRLTQIHENMDTQAPESMDERGLDVDTEADHALGD